MIAKPKVFHEVPEVPNFDKEAQAAIDYDGLPPLTPVKATEEVVLFTNVKDVYASVDAGVEHTFNAQAQDGYGTVVVVNGSIACVGIRGDCAAFASSKRPHVIDLKGGSIQPGLSSYGAPLGMREIDQEPVREFYRESFCYNAHICTLLYNSPLATGCALPQLCTLWLTQLICRSYSILSEPTHLEFWVVRL